jgi:hypothetical protein
LGKLRRREEEVAHAAEVEALEAKLKNQETVFSQKVYEVRRCPKLLP